MTDTTPIDVVYVGKRGLEKGGLADAWVTLAFLSDLTKPGDDPFVWEKLEQATSLFDTKKQKHVQPAIIGGVYTMDAALTDGRITTARTGTRKFLRRLDDAELIARLDGVDSAERARDKSAKQLAKLKSDHALEGDLQALRRHYHRIPFPDRTAFELTVLSYIRKRG